MPPTARPPSKEEKDKTPRPPASKKRTPANMEDIVGRMDRLETRVREIEGRSKAPATKRPPSGNN